MSDGTYDAYRPPTATILDEPRAVYPPVEDRARRYPQRRVGLPVVLFLATCLSTLFVGSLAREGLDLPSGLAYSGALMTILLCHEFGHFLQARRYKVYATYPYFIPMPIPPIGTLGAVIAMAAREGDRKALFDIGITGPLAGLVPTLIFCTVGVYTSEVDLAPQARGAIEFGEPLLFQYLVGLIHGPLPEGLALYLSPLAHAGWVGLLITALNLIPISQLDGGHVLYALLREKAHAVTVTLLVAAVIAVVVLQYYWWTLMLMLLVLIGPKHPPTADDNVRLGPLRTVLGWLTLGFVIVGFTPRPFWVT